MSDKVNFSAAERESGLGRIKERLDKVRALIQEPEFLKGKGLSNEVNIRIFCYEPENEMVVRHFVNQLETDQSLDCHLIVCNLYKTFLSICDDMDITTGRCTHVDRGRRGVSVYENSYVTGSFAAVFFECSDFGYVSG